MLGAIIGDIAGSRFEFNNIHTKDFEFFHPDCQITDDSAMTIALMAAILEGDMQNEMSFKKTVIDCYKRFWTLYPQGGYGLGFWEWLESDDPQPYHSYGNGACMRISPAAVLDEGVRERVAKWATEVSHNHPISLAWVNLFVTAVSMVKDMPADDGKQYLRNILQYTLSDEHSAEFYVDGIAKVHPGVFDETVQGTMPIAIKAVLEAEDFEDTVRTAISYGGDSDTIAAIAGAIAESVFGIPQSIKRACLRYIPVTMVSTVAKFHHRYPNFS